jgi:hypothetical protein
MFHVVASIQRPVTQMRTETGTCEPHSAALCSSKSSCLFFYQGLPAAFTSFKDGACCSCLRRCLLGGLRVVSRLLGMASRNTSMPKVCVPRFQTNLLCQLAADKATRGRHFVNPRHEESTPRANCLSLLASPFLPFLETIPNQFLRKIDGFFRSRRQDVALQCVAG